MTHSSTSLQSKVSLNVYVTPMRPMVGTPPQGPGDEPLWSPMSSTLLYGERDAILVDTLVTFDQVDALTDWVNSFQKRVTTILITHGHSDHWIGLQQLLKHFPGVRTMVRPAVRDRAQFEATNPTLRTYWQGIFPGEIPENPTMPDGMTETFVELEGHRIDLIDIGQGDTEHSTIMHVPSIAAIVAGDVVYDQVHMMIGETDEQSRQKWMDNLDRIAAMKPQMIVAGHKRVGTAAGPENIAESKQYLADFSRVVKEHETVETIVQAMLTLHPNRDNPRVVWHSARQAVAKSTYEKQIRGATILTRNHEGLIERIQLYHSPLPVVMELAGELAQRLKAERRSGCTERVAILGTQCVRAVTLYAVPCH